MTNSFINLLSKSYFRKESSEEDIIDACRSIISHLKQMQLVHIIVVL